MMLLNVSVSCLLFLGFVMLSMAMPRHYRELAVYYPGWRKQLPQWGQQSLRISGFAMLVAGAWLCISVDGAGRGLVLWFALLTLTAWLLVLVLKYLPGKMLLLSVVAGLGGLSAALF